MLDCVIVGGGIVGLATALQLQRRQPGLKLLIEKRSPPPPTKLATIAGVIYSGLYYKPGSPATNCIRGYHLLVDFAAESPLICVERL